MLLNNRTSHDLEVISEYNRSFGYGVHLHLCLHSPFPKKFPYLAGYPLASLLKVAFWFPRRRLGVIDCLATRAKCLGDLSIERRRSQKPVPSFYAFIE